MKKVSQVFWAFLMLLIFMSVTEPNLYGFKSAFGKTSSSSDLKKLSVGYVIAVKRSTYDDEGWKKVAKKLEGKHRGKVVFYKSQPEEILPTLKAIRPRYLCFVMKPGDATKDAVIKINKLTRQLDKDPYGDVIWGIVTGYTAADAFRLVAVPHLHIKRGLGKTQVAWLRYLESGAYYSEAVKNHKYIKNKGEKISKVTGPSDTTSEIVSALNAGKVDIMWTSGHASESDWQLGWAFPDGVFYTDAGQLKARDTSGREYHIKSPHPMVYYGPGNCLIGHINNPRNCMALSWIRAGACQFAGYVKPSGYGYMGWGIGEYFFPLKNQFTFAESVFLNNQALIFDLKNNVPGINKGGHQGDRDEFVFYGDPALEARIVSTPEPPLYSQNLIFEKIGRNQYRVKFSVRMEKKGKVVRPAAAFLPRSVVSIKDLKSNSYKVDISDDFILMTLNNPSKRELSKGEKRYVTFIANISKEKVSKRDDYSANEEQQALNAQSNAIDIDDLKHLAYTLHPSSDRSIQVKLFNGKYSRTDSPAEFVMTSIHEIATGDLNGDGKPDAAVILFSNYGGSGTFGELAAVINEDGLLRHVASAPLGDRVVIKSLAIDSGIIAVDMLTHGPKDPMATPTLRKIKKFKLVGEKLVGFSADTSGQLQEDSHEAQVKKDLSMIITLKVAGQIQKTDAWTDPQLDPHNWHKPMYYIALDANGDPSDGYYDNGKGSYSALIQYDSGRYRLTWGGPDQNIHTKADNVVCPPTGWLSQGVSPEQIECAEDFAASISEDGTSLIVYLRLYLIGNPSSLEVSFMASPLTSSHLDVLGNKPGDDGHQGWIVIPDATIQRGYSKKDAPEDLVWPIEAPDLKANFDIIGGHVKILHVQ